MGYYEDLIGLEPRKPMWGMFDKGEDKEREEEYKKLSEKYGFDITETWNLDTCFIYWIYPRLKFFRDKSCGIPSGTSEDEWNGILDEMIYGFEKYIKTFVDIDENETYEEFEERTKVDYDSLFKSLDLFKEHFLNLWD